MGKSYTQPKKSVWEDSTMAWPTLVAIDGNPILYSIMELGPPWFKLLPLRELNFKTTIYNKFFIAFSSALDYIDQIHDTLNVSKKFL